jgi:hypothetical protein
MAGVLFAIAFGSLMLPAGSDARGTGVPTSCADGPHAQVFDHTSTAVMIYWMAADPMPPDWTIERSVDGVNWTTIATVPAPATACTDWVKYLDGGLVPDTLYYYRVAGSSVLSITTSPPPIVISPVGDPAAAVSSYPAEQCNDLGSCTQWADVVNAPFGGSFQTVGPAVGCGSDCWRYNARPQYTYADGHTAALQVMVPEGYELDDTNTFAGGRYAPCGTNDSCNVGGAAWVAGHTLLGTNGLPLLVLCSGYPINPTPAILAEMVGPHAELIMRSTTDPHQAWIYFVRFGGETPACATANTTTSTTATYRWGQLWTASDTAKLYHRGHLVKQATLGKLGFGHHRWAFAHHHGRYRVKLCGTRTRRGSTNVRACITRRYRF